MTSRFNKLFAIALISVVALMNAQATTALMGRLKTRDNKPVMVNGHKATSGTTLMSGSQIQSGKVGTTVDLGALGRIDMAPDTDLTVVFKASEVSVQLRSGYVVLTTNKGVTGVVNTADGETFRTEGKNTASVVAKMKGVSGPEAAAKAGATKGGMSTGAVVGVAGAGAAVVGGAAAKSSGRGGSLSPNRP
jgi:hypothetical protein